MVDTAWLNVVVGAGVHNDGVIVDVLYLVAGVVVAGLAWTAVVSLRHGRREARSVRIDLPRYRRLRRRYMISATILGLTVFTVPDPPHPPTIAEFLLYAAGGLATLVVLGDIDRQRRRLPE